MRLQVLSPRWASQLAVLVGALAFLAPHAHSFWIAENPSFLDRESTLPITSLLLFTGGLVLAAMSSKPFWRLNFWVMMGVMLGVLFYVALTTDFTGGHVFGAFNPLSLWPVLFVLAFLLTAPIVAVGALLGRVLGRVVGGPPTRPADRGARPAAAS